MTGCVRTGSQICRRVGQWNYKPAMERCRRGRAASYERAGVGGRTPEGRAAGGEL